MYLVYWLIVNYLINVLEAGAKKTNTSVDDGFVTLVSRHTRDAQGAVLLAPILVMGYIACYPLGE